MKPNGLTDAPPELIEVLEDRLRVNTDRSAGCWRWTASLNAGGYPQMTVGGRSAPAHRVAYVLTHGAIPDGMEIDHACRERSCVNPDHLQAVTHRSNSENLGVRRDNASGIRGVRERRGRYEVRVTHRGVEYWGGTHPTRGQAEDAAIALRNKLHQNNLADHGHRSNPRTRSSNSISAHAA